MADGEQPDPLDAWAHGIAAYLDFVQEFHGDEVDIDFSGTSLGGWEQLLVYLFGTRPRWRGRPSSGRSRA